MSSLRKIKITAALLLKVVALSATLCATQSFAMPSFGRQTGMDCSGCHIGAFGPQLTPAGILFKLNGYTDSDGAAGKNPLSAMVVTSFSKTKTDQTPAPAGLKENNNVKMDQASVFYAGKITEHLGAFVQVTHNGVDHTTILDELDVRYARPLELGGKDVIAGMSVNNNPGVQDPFNALPVWSFPFVSSPAGFGTGSTTLINGGLAGRVIGASAYTLFDKSIYAELGSYKSMSPKGQSLLGVGEDQQRLGNNAYWRLAWMKDQKSQAFHLGVFGWKASLAPDRTVDAPKDTYKDLGVDASYQFLGTREHIGTVNFSHIKENKNEGSTGDTITLKETRLNASYHYNQTWGGTVGVFSTRGSDPTVATRGSIIQADWTPWGKENASAPSPFGSANVRLGAQYWMYSKFAGESTGARDHNTLYLFAWTSF